MITSLVPSQNIAQWVCAVLIIAFIAQASLVTACSDGKTKVQEKASLKPRWMYKVQSPGFPNNYPPNTNCSWTFTAPGDYELLVALRHFQVEPSKECRSDYLHVSFTDHPIPNWRRYCSVLSDNYINSLHLKRKIHLVPSQRMTLLFISDNSSEFKGFEGEVRLIAPALVPPNNKEEYCVNRLNDTSGTFSSPKHPHPYPTNMSCTWHIAVPDGKKVHLRFTSFDLENATNKDGDCTNDYVEIREGVWGRRGGIILGRLCGNKDTRKVIESPSDQMWVRFVSDNDPSNKHKGFYAEFKDSTWSSGSRFLSSFNYICVGVIFVFIWF
uniref:Tolloid-like protein 2 n=1 Tax=Actinia tenebrosa TaxID=6105 RepID=A0A6P8I6B2_ACTTE